MNEFNTVSGLDSDDPLLAHLRALQPADLVGFESRVMYSAGRADAIREFSVRAMRRVWLNAAAMLLIAAGSSALTWGFAGRELQRANSVASTEHSTGNTASVVTVESNPLQNAILHPVVQTRQRTSMDESLNQLLDELLEHHGQSISRTWDSMEVSSSETSAQPVSTGPKTWLQLQREMLKENSTF